MWLKVDIVTAAGSILVHLNQDTSQVVSAISFGGINVCCGDVRSFALHLTAADTSNSCKRGFYALPLPRIEHGALHVTVGKRGLRREQHNTKHGRPGAGHDL
jgi:hypothetical protein